MWVALLVAGLVLLATRFRWRTATRAARTAAVAAVLAFTAAGGAYIATVSLQKTFVPGASLSAQFEADPRLKIWAYAAERIGERPWLGYGYGRGILRKDFRVKFEGNLYNWHGHNLFLNAAMGGGIVLVGALVALLASLAYALAAQRSREPCLCGGSRGAGRGARQEPDRRRADPGKLVAAVVARGNGARGRSGAPSSRPGNSGQANRPLRSTSIAGAAARRSAAGCPVFSARA